MADYSTGLPAEIVEKRKVRRREVEVREPYHRQRDIGEIGHDCENAWRDHTRNEVKIPAHLRMRRTSVEGHYLPREDRDLIPHVAIAKPTMRTVLRDLSYAGERQPSPRCDIQQHRRDGGIRRGWIAPRIVKAKDRAR